MAHFFLFPKHTHDYVREFINMDLDNVSKTCFLEIPSELSFAMTYNSHFVPFSYCFFGFGVFCFVLFFGVLAVGCF